MNISAVLCLPSFDGWPQRAVTDVKVEVFDTPASYEDIQAGSADVATIYYTRLGDLSIYLKVQPPGANEFGVGESIAGPLSHSVLSPQLGTIIVVEEDADIIIDQVTNQSVWAVSLCVRGMGVAAYQR